MGKKKKTNSPFFQWRKFVKLHYGVMHICLGSCTSNLLVISFGEKCLLKSLHSCGSVVFSSSRVILEIGQKQQSSLLNKGRVWLLELLAENAWSNIFSEEQYFYTVLSKYLNLALLLCLSLSGLSPLVLAAKCDAICLRPESSEMDVFTRQLITMSDAASGCVSGDMLARCSHHDLMRRFSCSNAPSATLCNSEAPS